MYLQGGAIWHPRCGPGPSEGAGVSSIYNGTNGHFTDAEIDHISNSAMSEIQVRFLFV
jgi:actin-binding LIM protein